MEGSRVDRTTPTSNGPRRVGRALDATVPCDAATVPHAATVPVTPQDRSLTGRLVLDRCMRVCMGAGGSDFEVRLVPVTLLPPSLWPRPCVAAGLFFFESRVAQLHSSFIQLHHNNPTFASRWQMVFYTGSASHVVLSDRVPVSLRSSMHIKIDMVFLVVLRLVHPICFFSSFAS